MMACARYCEPARWLALAVAVAALAATHPVLADESSAVREAQASAREVMEAFLEAFNARDEAAWADTLQYPHVRIAGGNVMVYPDRAAFLENMDLSRFAEETGWDYSTWDDMKVIQVSPQKVHIAVTFTRYDEQGSKMASFESMYVVENVGGRWGVRARSSFAP
jgi:hypothetical protein